jgi:hypothetical protein
LIIQCDSGHLNSDLIACAKYRIDDIWENCCTKEFPCYVVFTVLIPREHNKSSFGSFLGGDWTCVHVDDFYPENDYSPISLALSNTPLSTLFYDETSEINNNIVSPDSISFNHCRFLYKNITAVLNLSNPNSKFASRCHQLKNILYRQLMVHPSMNSGMFSYRVIPTLFLFIIIRVLQKCCPIYI